MCVLVESAWVATVINATRGQLVSRSRRKLHARATFSAIREASPAVGRAGSE